MSGHLHVPALLANDLAVTSAIAIKLTQTYPRHHPVMQAMLFKGMCGKELSL